MPPKRMTANPMRPARYRPGKPIVLEHSDSDSDSESEASETSEANQHPLKPTYTKQRKVEATVVSKALKDVDLQKRFDKTHEEDEARKATTEVIAHEEGENSSDEYTTESVSESSEEGEEDELPAPRTLLRPTFIARNKRTSSIQTNTTADLKRKSEEERRKKVEAKESLEQHLKRDVVTKSAGRKNWDGDNDEEATIDDTDGLDSAAERAAWKLRELLRVKREREALKSIENERAEIERRREMDPELRNKEDLEYVQEQKKQKLDSRGKMGFMQKFYHKGAFYQDESEVLKRDYATAPVEDSAKNREILPKYMQVRGDEVGKRGRTRWTHLSAEDTTIQEGGSLLNPRNKLDGTRINQQDERFKPDKNREDIHHRDGFRSGQNRSRDRDNSGCGRQRSQSRSMNNNREQTDRYKPDHNHNCKRSYSPRGHEGVAEKRRR